MTDARLGGLGREALVSSTGELRAGGVVRETLVSGVGVAGRAGGRSRGGASPSVLFSGVLVSASAKAQSYTRATLRLNVGLAARATTQSKARGSIPQPPPVLRARAGGRSAARIIRVTCAVWDGGASTWDSGDSEWDCPLIVGARARAMSSAEGTVSTAPIAPGAARQYAVSIIG